MSGLNDQFIMPDDSLEPTPAEAGQQVVVHAFKDEGVDGEPQLRDDIDLISTACESLEVQLRDLELLKQSIVGQKGMNQSIALEAESLMPGFINEDRPIGFFTKHPSKTLLNAALEEVEEKTGGIVEKIKNFVIEMIKKIVDWFKGVIAAVQKKGVTTEENTKLLAHAKQEVPQMATAFLGYEKETQEVINKAKERARVLAAQAAEAGAQKAHNDTVEAQAKANAETKHAEDLAEKQRQDVAKAEADRIAKEKADKLAKLMQVIDGMRGPEFYSNALLTELNSMLSRLPHVQKLLGDSSVVQALMATHEDSTVNVNLLLADVKRGVANKDFDAIATALDSDRFSKIAAAADEHAKVLIQFKQLNNDYRADSLDSFFRAATNPQLLAAFSYGAEAIQGDQKDQQALLAGMEELMTDLYRMRLYTPDADKEASGKDSLDKLKSFSKQVLVPATQRIAFSYGVVVQLIGFLKGLQNLKANLQKVVSHKLREKVLEEAKNIGMDEKDALAVLG